MRNFRMGIEPSIVVFTVKKRAVATRSDGPIILVYKKVIHKISTYLCTATLYNTLVPVSWELGRGWSYLVKTRFKVGKELECFIRM